MEDIVSTEFVIVGAGGFGRELHDWILAYHENAIFSGFIDDDASKKGVICSIENYKNPNVNMYLGVGSPVLRKEISSKLDGGVINFSSLISPLSQIATSSQLGFGLILLGNSSLATNTVIGNGCLIQGFSVLGHDVQCGDYVSIYSFVFVCGGAIIGSGVSLYPHSVILPGVKVGMNSTVGAGSVVISDVPENATVFGNPAKVIKRN
jgi:sugar O-acyltransferase (sialic acid O-acetyltransferase NeuD family)